MNRLIDTHGYIGSSKIFEVDVPPEHYRKLKDDIKNKINTHNEQIKNLEAEIDQYKKQVETISKETQTLQSTVKSLDIVNKQLSTDIKVTKNKIDATSLSVEKLNIEIADKEAGITGNVDAIAETIRRVNESE